MTLMKIDINDNVFHTLILYSPNNVYLQYSSLMIEIHNKLASVIILLPLMSGIACRCTTLYIDVKVGELY